VLDDLGNPLAPDTQLFVGDVFQLHVYLTDELGNLLLLFFFYDNDDGNFDDNHYVLHYLLFVTACGN
jgi:hypothetical protein